MTRHDTSFFSQLVLLRDYLTQFAEEKTPAISLSIDSNSTSTLNQLSNLFGLSLFEQQLVLLCAGIELDIEILRLCGKLQNNEQTPTVTFQLALSLFSETAHWDALSPNSPLRRWCLLETGESLSWTTKPLRITESVLHFLLNIDTLDSQLSMLLRPVMVSNVVTVTQQQIATQLTQSLQDHSLDALVVQLAGSDRDGQLRIAQLAYQQLYSARLYRLEVQQLPYQHQELAQLLAILKREALLRHCVYVIEQEIVSNDNKMFIKTLLEDLPGRCILLSHESPLALQSSVLALTVPAPTFKEQLQLWQTGLETLTLSFEPDVLENMVAQFRLNVMQIETILHAFQTESRHQQNSKTLWQYCRKQARRSFTDLAQLILPKASWEDLTLATHQREHLKNIVAQMKHRHRVYEQWGFTQKNNRGLGLCALFSGPSGTGKTLAAEVLANELNLDLYQIDLSTIVSKYIGETEKHLKKIFDAAEASGAILLFDEADALFGKRSDVKDSHDRYANMEISYLLQRMEAYRGLCILTTNLKSALDDAFLRRIRFIISFEFPNQAQRQQLWQRIFPCQMPTLNLNHQQLAQLNVAGGNVQSIALNAAFLAAEEQQAIQMRHIHRAAQAEYRKLEKVLSDAETQDWS